MNANFLAITSGVTSGTKDLRLGSLQTTTFLVANTCSCSSYANVDTSVTISQGANATVLNSTVLNSNLYLNLGEAELCTVTASTITPTKSYVKAEGTITDIATTNFTNGSLLVLQSTGVALYVDASSTIVLGAVERELDTVCDRLTLTLLDGVWYELQYCNNN
jgi:uncharacterized protein YdaL